MSQDLPDDAPAKAGGSASDGEETLDELRRILLGDQRDKLERLEHRLDDRHEQARAVSDVLPEAVRLRGEHDEKLRRAMAPNIEEVIRESVKRRPRVLADALFPVMGPAIRRSILDTLQKFVQSLNQALEHSLSPQSFRWRVEAWRTGRPFAEVVLVHTLLYRVEQVFLIHRETGLLLQHAAIPAVEADDGDMVSGMLTAIQDFARDSFHVDEDEGLSAAKVGELTVWMEPGPQAGVAVVVRGTPPQELREKLAETVEEIHALESDALADFDGDATPFAGTRELLESLLIEQGQERAKRKNRNRLAAGFLVAVAAAVGLWIFFDVRDRLRWKDFLSRLEAEPGVVVTAEDRGERDVRGLRDAMAVEPRSVFREVYGDDVELAARFGAFDSHDAPIVLRRARARLGLPEDVRFELDAGTLRATGRATSAAIDAAAAEAPRLPGVSAVDFRGLVRTDAEAWRARRRAEEILAALPGVVVLRRSPSEIELLVDPSGERALDAALRDEDGRSLTERGGFTLRLRRTRSLDAAAAELRLRDTHALPAGASLRVADGGRVILSGVVTEEQLDALRKDVERDPALTGLDESGVAVVDAELRRAWTEYLATLRATPGVVVLEAGDGITDFRVRGLRDPLSPFTALVAPDPRLDDRIELDLAPYDSPEPPLALTRFRNALAAPPGVWARLEDGVLILTGRAPEAWAESARRAAPLIAGIRSVDLGGLEIERPERPFPPAWTEFVERLRAEPGYRIDVARREDDRLAVEGRRDEFARAPSELRAEVGLAASETRLDFGPFVSPDPVIALRRARATLDVPAGVTLAVREGVLVASGGAPAAWRARFEVAALEIPGIRAVDARGLVDHDDRELTRRLEALALRVVVFEGGSSDVTPRQDPEIDAAAADLRRLLETASALGKTVRLEIVGLPDRLDAATAPRFEDDPEFYRARLSTALDRADAVRRLVATRAPELRERLTSIGANERAWRSEDERSQAAKLGPAVIFRGVIAP